MCSALNRALQLIKMDVESPVVVFFFPINGNNYLIVGKL